MEPEQFTQIDIFPGQMFKTWKDFENLLQLRKELFNEKLVLSKGNVSVCRANSKIKANDAVRYRESFKYAWVNLRCVHEGQFKSKTRKQKRVRVSERIGCPVTVRLVAKRDKDILEVVQSEMNHNHEMNPPSQDIHVKLRDGVPMKVTGALIAAVKKHEVLYNTTLEQYKNRHLQEAAWREVAMETGHGSVFCRTNWEKMKGAYKSMREKNKYKEEDSEGEIVRGSQYQRRNHFMYKSLSFLKDFIDIEVDYSTKPIVIPPTVYSENNDYSVKITKNIPSGAIGSHQNTLIVKIDHDNKVVEYMEGNENDLITFDGQTLPLLPTKTEIVEEEESHDNENLISFSHDHNPLLLQQNEIAVSEAPSYVSLPPPKKKQKVETDTKPKSPKLQKPVKIEPTEALPPEDPIQAAILDFLNTTAKKEDDPDLNYLKSILPYIKQMNEKNRRTFILKTTNLCFELIDNQEESIVQPKNPTVGPVVE